MPDPSAGPNDRAGFIDAPVIGPPKSASRPTVPPIAIAAASPTARVSVLTAITTNMSANVSSAGARPGEVARDGEGERHRRVQVRSRHVADGVDHRDDH